VTVQGRGSIPWILPAILVPLVVVSAIVTPSAWLVLHFGKSYAATLPRPRPEAMTTLLYDRAGRLIGSLEDGVDRVPVTSSQIAPSLKQAVVAVEDKHFYHEGGVSLSGILRAAGEDLVHRSLEQGGSTITQQYVKLEYTGDQRTLTRKIHEAVLAERLAHTYTKDQILTMYLNTVYFGNGAYGAQAAAERYFGVPAWKLSVAQSALLAGMVQSPSLFDPFTDRDAAMGRRNVVLRDMAQQGFISSAVAAQLEASRVAVTRARPRPSPRDYFTANVSRVLQNRFGADLTFSGGLQVTTTLDSRYEQAAEEAITRVLHTPGDPSAALVAIDPTNGAVRAFVGGQNFAKVKFDLASGGHRQAGSAFKVFTLAAALEEGIPLTSVWTGPPTITIGDPRCSNGINIPWVVSNYADESAGTMTLAQAIAHSVNTIFAQVVTKVGPTKVAAVAHAMGIRSPLKAVCSITLGVNAVSPLDMADGYATLDARGIHHAPQFIQTVRSASGTVLFRLGTKGQRALPQNVADLETLALRGVITGGTGVAANIGRPAAGKTGTAQNFQDAWFCGYVPQLTTCVWVGYPRAETPMLNVEGFPQVFGGSLPAEIWRGFMSTVLARVPVRNFAGVAGGPPPAPLAPAPTSSPTPTSPPVPSPSPSHKPHHRPH
jgi:penicillin-binding protein 1A